jgi:hypothetical protein
MGTLRTAIDHPPESATSPLGQLTLRLELVIVACLVKISTEGAGGGVGEPCGVAVLCGDGVPSAVEVACSVSAVAVCSETTAGTTVLVPPRRRLIDSATMRIAATPPAKAPMSGQGGRLPGG